MKIMGVCFYFILLILLTAFPVAAEGVFVCSDFDLISIVDENKDVYSVTEENDRQHYIVKDSVVKQGDIVEFWTMRLETSESEQYADIGYVMGYFEVNTKTKKYKNVSNIAYSCDRRTLWKYNSNEPYMPIPPNSVIGFNAATALKIYKTNQHVK